MANRPSMRDGLSELFRRTDMGGDVAPPGFDDADEVVTGRAYVTTIKVVGVGGGGTNAVAPSVKLRTRTVPRSKRTSYGNARHSLTASWRR